MEVTEHVKLNNGRTITLNLSDYEHREILTAGVNFLLQKGWMVLSSNEDVVGTEEAIKEVESAISQSDEATKQ